jgi:hypothetical protein
MQGLAVGIGARGRCWGLLPHARAADVPEVRSSRCLSGSAGADPRRAATGLPAPPSYRRGGDALVPGRERRSEAVPVPALGITHPSRLHPTSVGETGRGCPPTERGDARWGPGPALRSEWNGTSPARQTAPGGCQTSGSGASRRLSRNESGGAFHRSSRGLAARRGQPGEDQRREENECNHDHGNDLQGLKLIRQFAVL